MATRDRDLKPTIPGLAAAAIWLLLAAAEAALLLTSLTGGDAVSWSGLAGAALLGLLLLVALNGFLVVQPNQASDIVDLDEERKAAMVSNLMVVLVSDRGAQPVVNSGSLYT